MTRATGLEDIAKTKITTIDVKQVENRIEMKGKENPIRSRCYMYILRAA
jgi:hypothetical protein